MCFDAIILFLISELQIMRRLVPLVLPHFQAFEFGNQHLSTNEYIKIIGKKLKILYYI